MMAEEQKQETFQCSTCKKKFHPAGFKVSRLGIRLKTCLECNARCKAERERSKCVHRKRKSDCLVCSPDKFCEHGKRKAKHECAVCDPAGNDRRKHIRNAREFATQQDGWPYASDKRVHGPYGFYDMVVNRWKGVFEAMLAEKIIDAEYHTKILSRLLPWVGPQEN